MWQWRVVLLPAFVCGVNIGVARGAPADGGSALVLRYPGVVNSETVGLAFIQTSAVALPTKGTAFWKSSRPGALSLAEALSLQNPLTTPARGTLGPLHIDADAIHEELENLGLETKTKGVRNTMSLLWALAFSVAACGGLYLFFGRNRSLYPLIYSNNVLTREAPELVPDQGDSNRADMEFLNERWGWWKASMETDLEQVAESKGLDEAMLLQYIELCKKILWRIGNPLLFFIGPVHAIFGGAWATSVHWQDYTNIFSINDVDLGSGVYWIDALFVWYVCHAVVSCVWEAEEDFRDRHYQWLRHKPNIQSRTLLLQGIPEDKRKDDLVKDFFGRLFGEGKVIEAHIARDTHLLVHLMHQHADAQKKLDMYKDMFEKTGKRPSAWTSGDYIDLYTEKLKALDEEIKIEMQRVEKAAKESVGGCNEHSGFVTFKDERWASIALTQRYSEDRTEWRLDLAPEPFDVIWSDLERDPRFRHHYHLFGILFVAATYLGYFIVFVHIYELDECFHNDLWHALGPQISVQVALIFLPCILYWILHRFFTLKAHSWAQKRLQTALYSFQVVMLVPILTIVFSDGDNVLYTAFVEPLALVDLLGKVIPGAANFYLKFMVLQWVTPFISLTRFSVLQRYWRYVQFYKPEKAHTLAEPEDQYFSGIGARSARFSVQMCITMVFGTINPLILVAGYINFYFKRAVYGYLIAFAESRKSDLGGKFWFTSLRELYGICGFYTILMSIVVGGRYQHFGFTPACVSLLALVYIAYAYQKFNAEFPWEDVLPIALSRKKMNESKSSRKVVGAYFQCELKPQEWANAQELREEDTLLTANDTGNESPDSPGPRVKRRLAHLKTYSPYHPLHEHIMEHHDSWRAAEPGLHRPRRISKSKSFAV